MANGSSFTHEGVSGVATFTHEDQPPPDQQQRLLGEQLRGAAQRERLYGPDGQPKEELPDPRIRMLTPTYRVVAPNAKRKGNTIYLNGVIIIEKRGAASLGEVTWTEIVRYERPHISSESNAADLALYTLLGNGATI